MLYRHMEADGVPHGYDRWRKVGVVRNPVDRLWSLYKYLQRFGLDWCAEHDETYTARMRASVEQPFEQWLIGNDCRSQRHTIARDSGVSSRPTLAAIRCPKIGRASSSIFGQTLARPSIASVTSSPRSMPTLA